jgi:hypothetical protein
MEVTDVPTSRAREKVDERVAILGLDFEDENAEKELAASFSSFATTVQNRLDSNGSGSPIALSGSLEAQVARALSQVTRQSSSYSENLSTATALASSRSNGSIVGNGLGPDLPTAQKVLVGEATATQANLLPALDALQPLSAFAHATDVAAYRDIVRAEVLALTTEFARPDQPRPVRVRVLFGALLGWAYAPGTTLNVGQGQPSGDLAALTYLAGLCPPVVDSALTEDQLALQDVVKSDAKRLFDLWVAFEYPGGVTESNTPAIIWPGYERTDTKLGGLAAVQNRFCSPPTEQPLYSFSERMIRADQLLPVLSHDSDQVAGALDAIGFGPGAQETVPIPNLLSFTDNDLDPNAHDYYFVLLPILRARQQNLAFGLTVKDLLDWASDLAGGSGYDLLRRAGQLGLDLLADQADELFWIVATLLYQPPDQIPELRDTQVQIELRSLARDLSALADLSN